MIVDLFESDLAKCKNSYPARKNIFGRHYMYTYMADHTINEVFPDAGS